MNIIRKFFNFNKKYYNLFSCDSYEREYTYSRINDFINYYKYCPLVYTNINLITDNAIDVKPRIYDKKNQEFIDHEIITLLENPNTYENRNHFFKRFLTEYLATGNAYIKITKSLSGNAILRLDVLDSTYIRIQDNGSHYIQEYHYNSINNNVVFKRDNIDNVYLSADGDELIHFKNPAPCYEGYGLSPLSACQVKIEQYQNLNIHNWSFIKNGGRPSMFVKVDSNKYAGSIDKWEEVKQQIVDNVKGSKNAGSIIMGEDGFEVTELSNNIKDMDYKDLEKSTIAAVANTFKIPLPLVLPEQMTLANMEQAKYNLYDNVIIPLIKDVFNFLEDKLFRYYKIKDDLKISYDPASIETLANRKSQEVLELSKSGVLTINEIRAKLGYEAIDGGDEVYKPMSSIAIGRDNYTEDNREKPADKKEFIKRIAEITDDNGNPYYSLDEIVEASNKIH